MLFARRIECLGEAAQIGGRALVEHDMVDEAVVARVACGRFAFVGQMEVGIGGLRIVDILPDGVAGKREAPVPVAQHHEPVGAARGRIDPSFKRRDLIEQHRAGLGFAPGEAARFEMDAEQADSRLALRPQRDVDARAELGIAEHQGRDVGMALEVDALADGEPDRLADDLRFGMLAAAGAARCARPLFHDDREARRIEDSARRGYILCLLEGDDIGVEAVGDPPHGGIILGRARLASHAILFGEEFDVPARNLERALCGLGRYRDDLRSAAGGEEKRERSDNIFEHQALVRRSLFNINCHARRISAGF